LLENTLYGAGNIFVCWQYGVLGIGCAGCGRAYGAVARYFDDTVSLRRIRNVEGHAPFGLCCHWEFFGNDNA
jgi:hypothetical protein